MNDLKLNFIFQKKGLHSYFFIINIIILKKLVWPLIFISTNPSLFLSLVILQVHHTAVSPDEVCLRVVRVMDAPLTRPQPAGAAAAHQPVPEDEDGGEHAGCDVETNDSEKKLFNIIVKPWNSFIFIINRNRVML